MTNSQAKAETMSHTPEPSHIDVDLHSLGESLSGEVIHGALEDAAVAVGIAAVATAAQKVGLKNVDSERVHKTVEVAKGAQKVGATALATGAAVSTATGLTVAATSGAGIASGLAAAGGIVGGGMAAGPAVLAGGPAYLATKGLNATVFKDEEGLSTEEARGRAAARKATSTGAAVGVLGVSAATVAGGASAAGIMGTLATVGGVVGGGAIAGAGVLVAAPVVLAAAAGFGAYKLWGRKGGSESKSVPAKRKPGTK